MGSFRRLDICDELAVGCTSISHPLKEPRRISEIVQESVLCLDPCTTLRRSEEYGTSTLNKLDRQWKAQVWCFRKKRMYILKNKTKSLSFQTMQMNCMMKSTNWMKIQKTERSMTQQVKRTVSQKTPYPSLLSPADWLNELLDRISSLRCHQRIGSMSCWTEYYLSILTSKLAQ